MRRGTTPTIRAIVKKNDLTEYNLYLTFKCGAVRTIKSGSDLNVTLDGEDTRIECALTQKDTLAFPAGQKCEVQIRAERANGTVAVATTIGSVPVERILQDGIIGA